MKNHFAEILNTDSVFCEQINRISLEASPLTNNITGLWMSPLATIINSDSASAIANDFEIQPLTFIWTLSTQACRNFDADTFNVDFYATDLEANSEEFSVLFNDTLANIELIANKLGVQYH